MGMKREWLNRGAIDWLSSWLLAAAGRRGRNLVCLCGQFIHPQSITKPNLPLLAPTLLDEDGLDQKGEGAECISSPSTTLSTLAILPHSHDHDENTGVGERCPLSVSLFPGP